MINMVIIYLAIKVYGLMWYILTKSESEVFELKSVYEKVNCNLTKIFEMNEVLSNKFDQIRVSQ